MLDVKQCRLSGFSLEETLRAMGPRLLHVHLSDCAAGEPCLLPGQGDFDLEALKRRLEELGFSGTAVTEVYRRNFREEKELGDALLVVKKALEDPRFLTKSLLFPVFQVYNGAGENFLEVSPL